MYVDSEEEARYVATITGIDIEIVRQVQLAQMEYLEALGIAHPVDPATN